MAQPGYPPISEMKSSYLQFALRSITNPTYDYLIDAVD